MIQYIDMTKNKKINLDSGFLFSRAVFETILITTKAVFLEEHIERLNASLIKLKINKAITIKSIEDCIDKHHLSHCVLKIVVSENNTIATTREIIYKEEDYKSGFALCRSNLIRNSTSLLTYIKSTGYIENILEKESAVENGFNEALFLNERGFISECSMSNIFFVTKGVLYTPKISCGLLPGILRQWVIQNYSVVEGEFTRDEILLADEVFITNSVMGIMKVSSIDTNIYDNSSISITRLLRDTYRKMHLLVLMVIMSITILMIPNF